MQNSKNTRRGFTLIELLTVIAIIGILAAILIPAVGAVRVKAAQASSQSNLKQIALSYNNFSISGSRTRIITKGGWTARGTAANSPAEWAQVLAELGGLNDGQLYFIGSDVNVAGLAQIPQVVLTNIGTTSAAAPTPEWTAAKSAVSYEMGVGLSPNAQATITPLIWTRGLETDGRWDATSPWDGKGGHIAFMDGHVSFYEDVVGQLVTPAGVSTNNIVDALGSADKILKL